MNWRDQLQPASFRGIEFFVDSREYRFGRKNIFHDYPFRDETELEDQGKATDEFTLDAYVLQRLVKKADVTTGAPAEFDYINARNNLIAVLLAPGPGKLVDRYGLGERNVGLEGKASMSETSKEGGIARFRMTFKEVGGSRPPVIVIDPIVSMDVIADDSLLRSVDAFFSVLNGLTSDLQVLTADINKGMQDITSRIRQLKGISGTIISAATSIVSQANALAEESISAPCDLANSLTGGFDSFLFAAGMLSDTVSRDILGACSGRVQNEDDAERNSDELSAEESISIATAASALSTYGSDLPPINVVSPSSAGTQASRQANINLFRIMGLINACRIAVRGTYTSQEQAEDLLLLISNAIDALLDYLGDEAGSSLLADFGIVFNNDEIYQSVSQLKPALKKSMDTIGASLAKTVQHLVRDEVQSTLTLAYDEYEDLSRDKEILDRNAVLIINPCFIPNGKTISILSE
jgi:prophage DNA circulation protein